jgi:hypothetical protein
LFNTHPPIGYLTTDKHKASFSLPDENNNSCELRNFTLHLTVGSYAYFQGMPCGGFGLQNHPDFAGNWAMDSPSIEPSPLLCLHGFTI